MVLQTERLSLRELTQADLPDLKEILQNPEVVYAYEYELTDADVHMATCRTVFLPRHAIRRKAGHDGFSFCCACLSRKLPLRSRTA